MWPVLSAKHALLLPLANNRVGNAVPADIGSRHTLIGWGEFEPRERHISTVEFELPVLQCSLYGGLVDDPGAFEAVESPLD